MAPMQRNNYHLPAFFLAAFFLWPFLLCAQGIAARGGPKAETDAEVWGGLVYAIEGGLSEGEKNVAKGPSFPVVSLGAELEKDLRSRLGRVFTGRNFYFLGEHTQGVFKQYESWLVPSKDLFLKLDSKGPVKGGGVNLGLQLWQDKEVIMKTDVILRPDSPLFIEGPAWRRGKLLFVVLLKGE